MNSSIPLPPRTSRPAALAEGQKRGLMYDPAEVRREVEQDKEIGNYRRYLANVTDENHAMAIERKRIHYRLRAIEKSMVRNAEKLGKYQAYLALLREQKFKQIVSGKILEARKKLFSEP